MAIDLRLLATAEAEQIKDKEKWEEELDRLPVRERILWLGKICFFLTLAWTSCRATYAIFTPIVPALLLENNVDYIRYPFILGVGFYIVTTLLAVNGVHILFRTLRELDIALAWALFELILLARQWLKYVLATYVVVQTWTFWTGDPVHEPIEEHSGASPVDMIRSPRKSSLFKTLEKKISASFFGAAEEWYNGGLRSGRDFPPRLTDPPFGLSRGMSLGNSDGIMEDDAQNAFVVESQESEVQPNLSEWGKMHHFYRPSRISQRPLVGHQKSSLSGAKTTSRIASSTQSRQISEPIGLPPKTNPEEFGEVLESPGTFWPKLEIRLSRYRAEARETEKITDSWDLLSQDLKPFRARECLDKLRSLQTKMESDHELLYVKEQWNSVPMLDETISSVKRQLTFFNGTKPSTARTSLFKNTHTVNSPGFVGEEERLSCAQSNAKRVRTEPPESYWKSENRSIRRDMEAREATDYWTHEKLHMKDVSMKNRTIISTITNPGQRLRSELPRLMREATVLIQAQAGVREEKFTLEHLKEIVAQSRPIPDLIFDESGLRDRADRKALEESGMSNREFLTQIQSINHALRQLLTPAMDLQMSTSDTLSNEDEWLLDSIVRKAESFGHVLQTMLSSANETVRGILHTLQSRLAAVKKTHHAVLSSQEADSMTKAKFAELHGMALTIQKEFQELDVSFGSDTNQASCRELENGLNTLLDDLHVDETIFKRRQHFQVTGPTDLLHQLARAVLKGLRPTSTSSHNFLCGPRALVISLQALEALHPQHTADSILSMMFNDFAGGGHTKLPLNAQGQMTQAYASYLDVRLQSSGADDTTRRAMIDEANQMNNFTIQQLDFMLGFMVHMRLVEDKYQLSVVTEQCQGGPWMVQYQRHDEGNVPPRRTVWLYSDNAELRSAHQADWQDFAAKMKKSGRWSEELESLNRLVDTHKGSSVSHWSGFAMPSFNTLPVVRGWGMLEEMTETEGMCNVEKKSVKTETERILKQWKAQQNGRTPVTSAAHANTKTKGKDYGKEDMNFDSDDADDEQEEVQLIVGHEAPRRQKGQEQRPRVCRYFQAGDCKDGDQCKFAHVPDDEAQSFKNLKTQRNSDASKHAATKTSKQARDSKTASSAKIKTKDKNEDKSKGNSEQNGSKSNAQKTRSEPTGKPTSEKKNKKGSKHHAESHFTAKSQKEDHRPRQANSGSKKDKGRQEDESGRNFASFEDKTKKLDALMQSGKMQPGWAKLAR